MIILGRKKKTKNVPRPDSSNFEHSFELKGVFEKSQGISQSIRIKGGGGFAIPLDYHKLVGISSDDKEDANSLFVESQTLDLFLEETTFMRRMDEQENVIKKQ